MENQKIDISIIIPVYNVEEYLEECLDSVLAQTFKNYEVICIDDASTDSSLDVLKKYETKFEHYRIIEKKENEGLSAARNTGIVEAVGKYILFVDSDDMIVPHTCEKLYGIAEANSTDIVYFDYDYLYMDGTQGKAKKAPEPLKEVVSGEELFCYMQENRVVKFESWRQLYKKDIFEKYNISFRNGILHEDSLCSFFCILNAEKVMSIDESLYLYRQRPGSIMGTFDQKRVESVFVILCEISKYWLSRTFSERVNKNISSFFHDMYETYIYYKDSQKIHDFGILGSEEEKHLLRSITWTTQYLIVTDDQIDKLRNQENIIIYGAGRAAYNLYKFLSDKGIYVKDIVVTDTERNPKYLCGKEVKCVDQYDDRKDETTVLIGVTSKYASEIAESLKERGFSHVMMFEDGPR